MLATMLPPCAFAEGNHVVHIRVGGIFRRERGVFDARGQLEQDNLWDSSGQPARSRLPGTHLLLSVGELSRCEMRRYGVTMLGHGITIRASR